MISEINFSITLIKQMIQSETEQIPSFDRTQIMSALLPKLLITLPV